jgi:hypothetical protein
MKQLTNAIFKPSKPLFNELYPHCYPRTARTGCIQTMPPNIRQWPLEEKAWVKFRGKKSTGMDAFK